MGVFGQVAGGLARARSQADEIEERRHQREIQQLALMASLQDQDIVPENERETLQGELPDVSTIGGPMPKRASQQVDTGLVDPSRYRKLGQMNGQQYYKDRSRQIAGERAAAQKAKIAEALTRSEIAKNNRVEVKNAPNIDPLSDAGIAASAKRAGAVAAAEKPYKNVPEKQPKQPNEANTKAAGMLHRVIPAGQSLNKFDDRKTLDAIAAKAGTFGNWLSSPQGRQLSIAADAWIFGVLRPESGATIGDKERETYNHTYIPQPGDDEGTLAMKRQNRRLAEEGVAIQSGPAFPGGAHSAMEADSLANPAEFNAKYNSKSANADNDRAAAILLKHGVR